METCRTCFQTLKTTEQQGQIKSRASYAMDVRPCRAPGGRNDLWKRHSVANQSEVYRILTETASEKLILTHNSPQRLWSWPGGSQPRVLEPYSTSLMTESDPKNPVKLEGAQCPLSPQHAMAPTNPLNKIIILFQKSKRSIHNQVRLTKPLQPTPSY